MPTWLLLLAAFNKNLTGIPWIVGLATASVIAAATVIVTDRALGPTGTPRLGAFGRGVIIWSAVFLPLALIFGSGPESGLGVVVIPFLLASIVTGGVELARRTLGRR